jgi:hypothetical protein
MQKFALEKKKGDNAPVDQCFKKFPQFCVLARTVVSLPKTNLDLSCRQFCTGPLKV